MIYVVKVYLYGELTDEYAPVVLRPGLLTTRPHTVAAPPRSGLRLAVQDPDGNAVQVSVTVEGLVRGRAVRIWGGTNEEGIVHRFIESRDLQLQGADLAVQVSRTSWELENGSFRGYCSRRGYARCPEA